MGRLDELVATTWYHLGEEDPNSALRTANQALVLEGNNPKALECMGEVQSELGNTEDAIHYFERALGFTQKTALKQRLARAYMNHEKYGTALRLYEKLVRSNPQDIRSWYGIGAVHKELKNWDKTINAYRKVINIGIKTKIREGWLKGMPSTRGVDLAARFSEYRFTDAAYRGLISSLVEKERYVDMFKNIFAWKAFQARFLVYQFLSKLKP